MFEVFDDPTTTGFVDLVSLYRNWLVLLLGRLVMIYYQPPDHQQTLQAQVYTYTASLIKCIIMCWNMLLGCSYFFIYGF